MVTERYSDCTNMAGTPHAILNMSDRGNEVSNRLDARRAAADALAMRNPFENRFLTGAALIER